MLRIRCRRRRCQRCTGRWTSQQGCLRVHPGHRWLTSPTRCVPCRGTPSRRRRRRSACHSNWSGDCRHHRRTSRHHRRRRPRCRQLSFRTRAHRCTACLPWRVRRTAWSWLPRLRHRTMFRRALTSSHLFPGHRNRLRRHRRQRLSGHCRVMRRHRRRQSTPVTKCRIPQTMPTCLLRSNPDSTWRNCSVLRRHHRRRTKRCHVILRVRRPPR